MSTQLELAMVYGNAHNHFLAGDLMTGTVVVEVAEKIRIREFYAEIKCEANAGWTSLASDKIYESTEIYLRERVELAPTNTTVRPGQHGFKFHCPIPLKCPSSFEGLYGNVRYLTLVTLVAFEETTKPALNSFPFTVMARTNLATIPNTTRPIEMNDTTDYTCCCIPVGSVKIVLTIQRNGYVLGEDIPINMRLRNMSRQRLTAARLSLILQAKANAKSRYEQSNDTKEQEFMVAHKEIEAVQGRCEREVQTAMRVPDRTLPSFVGRIIEISYLIRFEASPGIAIEIPLTIATVNIDQRPQFFQPDEGYAEEAVTSINEETEIVYC